MVWVRGTLDMKSSKEVSSVVEDDEGRSAGVAAADWRLAGLRWRRCLEEDDSDARGANEFGLLKFVSGI